MVGWNIEMKMPLENLKCLCKDMEAKGWIVDIFRFVYKTKDYFVVVELYQPGEHRPKYALCRLKFIQKDNQGHQLTVPANSNSLMVDAKDLREFFGIEFAPNIGDIMEQFKEALGKFIPRELSEDKSDEEKEILCCNLSRSDSEDPSKIYCCKAKRNGKRADGKPGQRSWFNDNKTRLLRPTLYGVLGNDRSISFCYTADKALEQTDEKIIENLSH